MGGIVESRQQGNLADKPSEVQCDRQAAEFPPRKVALRQPQKQLGAGEGIAV